MTAIPTTMTHQDVSVLKRSKEPITPDTTANATSALSCDPPPPPLTEKCSVELITGPMGGGKTTRLLTELIQKESDGIRCRLFSFKKRRGDTTSNLHGSRNENTTEYKSHECTFLERFICPLQHQKPLSDGDDTTVTDPLQDLIRDKIKWVFIDEGQFFGDLLGFCKLLLLHEMNVTIACLNGTYMGNEWVNCRHLKCFATKITVIPGVCSTTGCEYPGVHSMKEGASMHSDDQLPCIGDLSSVDSNTPVKYYVLCNPCKIKTLFNTTEVASQMSQMKLSTQVS